MALDLWILCEKYLQQGKKPGFWGQLMNYFLRGVINRSFYQLSSEDMIKISQKRWYESKIKELTDEIKEIQKELDYFDFDEIMNEYTHLSMKLFYNVLARRYKGKERKIFDLSDLRQKSDEFICEYPVVLATTYSLRESLAQDVMYDYVVVDEASQVDIATGCLALSCAKNAIIVGDRKQLPNVVDTKTAEKTDAVFKEYRVPPAYQYKNHSLLDAVIEIFPNVPQTLLKEHYRCHPKIIEFCNRVFYDDQLIVLSKPKSSRKPLLIYETVAGNHARGHLNQRQIDVILEEIIPRQSLDSSDVSVGIITPYRDQADALKGVFEKKGIQADTVDKFQGREKDIIILSTVDNEISDFTDDANRLNVAVSRAIDQFILVVNKSNGRYNKNIDALINYIRYNNFEIIKSDVRSVFDLLYKGYYNRKMEILRKENKISDYDSENLMYVSIKKILKKDCFKFLDVAVRIPLKMVLCDFSKLTDREKVYAGNMLTHIDFLIFNKTDKAPCLAIEVDGTAYHQDSSRQKERDEMKNEILEKYKIPLLRFRTDGSLEERKLKEKLLEILNI